MRHYIFIVFSCFFLCMITFHVSAQENKPKVEDYYAEIKKNKQQKKAPLAATKKNIAKNYGQSYKRVPGSFTGYAIELLITNRPLARQDDMFRQFGKVYYDKLSNGEYSYCILANDFSSEASLEKYVENMVIHRAPKAQVVTYKTGKRKKLKKKKKGKKKNNKKCCPQLGEF